MLVEMFCTSSCELISADQPAPSQSGCSACNIFFFALLALLDGLTLFASILGVTWKERKFVNTWKRLAIMPCLAPMPDTRATINSVVV